MLFAISSLLSVAAWLTFPNKIVLIRICRLSTRLWWLLEYRLQIDVLEMCRKHNVPVVKNISATDSSMLTPTHFCNIIINNYLWKNKQHQIYAKLLPVSSFFSCNFGFSNTTYLLKSFTFAQNIVISNSFCSPPALTFDLGLWPLKVSTCTPSNWMQFAVLIFITAPRSHMYFMKYIATC